MSNETIFIDELSQENWEQTYKYGEEKTVDASLYRSAKELASKEKNPEYWTQKFFEILQNFKTTTGGRILSNAGTHLAGTTYINCFCSGPDCKDKDSIEGIFCELRKQGLILKSEGGYGFCSDFLRPRGSLIGGIGNQSPGSVKFLELWDKQSEIITLGSGKKKVGKTEKIKIRKGAQLVTKSIWHPDIQEFIHAKQTPGCLTKFNMSVLISDAFMQAVKNHLPWNLVFPDYQNQSTLYKEIWDGSIEKWIQSGGKTIIYKTFTDANELWDEIMLSAYNRNEPGVLFIDTINRRNNLRFCEYISATNPCIAKGYVVNTPNGYKKVEDINVGDEVCTVLGSEKVNKIEKHTNYPVFKVKFSDGMEQLVTSSHQYHILSKSNQTKKITKVKVGDLQIGDKIRVCATKFKENKFDELEYKNGLKAGLILGDGSYTDNLLSKGKIKIACDKREIDYINNIKTLFGSCDKDDIDNKSNSMNIIINFDKKEGDLLGLTPCYCETKNIKYSRISNKSFAIGLLDGLLSTDGNVNLKSNHPQIRFDTISPELAKIIRNVLLYLGCHGFISSSNSNGGNINGREIIRKHNKLTVTISGESFRSFSEYTKIYYFNPYKGNKIKEALQTFILSGNGWRASVISVEPFGTSDVYDLYCKESDTWITSGYVQVGCGEQVLPIGGCCLLGSINLSQFTNKANTGWDYSNLEQVIPIFVRMLDNVNDLSYVPLPEQQENLKNKRRIGIGVLGYGSALMMMKIRYGSPEALKITEELEDFIMNKVYQASALLAKEKGSFPIFILEEYEKSTTWQVLSEDTRKLIREYGLRNSHLLSIQPTGNTAVLANNVSNGLEPCFLHQYVRTVTQPYPPDGLIIPTQIDWDKKTFICEGKTMWDWTKEGDELLLITKFDGDVWKFDRNRGLTKECVVKDYAVRYHEKLGTWDENADWAATTANLNIDDHVETMKIFAKHVDSSISKTVNLPFEYSFDDFKNLYMKVFDTGVIKGCTSYRSGTMTSVMSEKSSASQLMIKKATCPKRPKRLPCDIHHIKYKNRNWVVIVGLLEGDPYEVFALRQKNISITKECPTGKLVKTKGHYNIELDNQEIIEDICEYFESDEEEAITRLISTSLRYGVDIEFIIAQLLKSSGTVFSFNKIIARTLKKYIKDGTELKAFKCGKCHGTRMKMNDGCAVCLDCAWSACS